MNPLLVLAAGLGAAADPWAGAQKVEIPGSRDGAAQPAMFYAPPSSGPPNPPSPEGTGGPSAHDAPRVRGVRGAAVPLLVALHTWSGDYRQPDGGAYLDECRRRGWALIHPNFRGPNRRPEACASDLAVQDVLDAVAYAREHAPVDGRRVYLVGASGGGHMSLVMAWRAPRVWAGVSAWVPTSDLAAWHRECERARPPRSYYRDLEGACGGPPGSPETDAEYHARSPLFHLAAARGLPLDLNAGIHDGHTGSVPVSHTLRAFNALAKANGHEEKEFSDAEIAFVAREQTIPLTLSDERVGDPARRRRVLLRRAAGPARVTLFEGGHEHDVPAALDWLARLP